MYLNIVARCGVVWKDFKKRGKTTMSIVIDTRLESDSIGKKQVPVKAYYGVQSLRAMENFSITGGRMHKEMIEALALLKKACAIANKKAGALEAVVADAIAAACA